MLKIIFYDEIINESLKGGQRYRQTLASAIADFLLNRIKTDKEVLKNGLYSYNLKEIAAKIPNMPEKGKEILNNLKLAVMEIPSLKYPLDFKGAAYLRSTYEPITTYLPSDPTDIKKLKDTTGLEPLEIPIEPGDVIVKILIKDSQTPTDEYSGSYKDIYKNIQYLKFSYFYIIK
jgi:hypothetical protein